VHDPLMLDYLVKTLGADKITLGTDYPFPLGELEPGQLIKSMPFSDDTKARMLGQNALDWLGLAAERFDAGLLKSARRMP
jgi:aminocarboxymuconate-semialdehyde decarboxylase